MTWEWNSTISYLTDCTFKETSPGIKFSAMFFFFFFPLRQMFHGSICWNHTPTALSLLSLTLPEIGNRNVLNMDGTPMARLIWRKSNELHDQYLVGMSDNGFCARSFWLNIKSDAAQTEMSFAQIKLDWSTDEWLTVPLQQERSLTHVAL